MATPQNATINTGSVQNVLISTPPSIENNDPIGDLQNSQRTAQQHLLPTAISNRFLNPVQQSPAPLNVNSVTLNDLGIVSQPISDGIVAPNTVALFIFSFTSTTPTPVSVELCASLFIDGTDFQNAYPFGGAVGSTEWAIERQKTAFFFDVNASPQTYQPNQSNQDTEFYIIKNLAATGNHELFIYYYWRAVSNQGGSKTV